ncbi:hypothetical protein K7G98_23430 [Saccharothrix sp. MB29]|nr:hypothetical protein [Saccharothrix sp. MB29]
MRRQARPSVGAPAARPATRSTQCAGSASDSCRRSPNAAWASSSRRSCLPVCAPRSDGSRRSTASAARLSEAGAARATRPGFRSALPRAGTISSPRRSLVRTSRAVPREIPTARATSRSVAFGYRAR